MAFIQLEKEKRIKRIKVAQGLMGHHQMDQYMHYKGPRRKREKKRQKAFKEIMDKYFTNLGKEIDIHTQEAQKIVKKTN